MTGTAAARPPRHRVVIVGGGFAGLYAAKQLKVDPDIAVTLVDRRNFHLFQPMLYQVATAGLNPSDIASPIRSILRRARNTDVLLAEVESVDVSTRVVHFTDGDSAHYD
jgi:NADH dehydrogenase